MCYNIAGLALSKFKKAIRKGIDEATLKILWKEYEKLREIYDSSEYFTNGWARPYLLTQLEQGATDFEAMQWTFVPSYLRGTKGLEDFYKKRYATLNATIERLFESPMYKDSAIRRRCILPVDGFYEYHHIRSKKLPFFIHGKDDKPLLLAGVWNSWVNEDTGEELRSFAIVTTKPNEIMGKLHNNPKAKNGSRMPALLTEELAAQWVEPINNESDRKIVEEAIISFPSEELVYTPVAKLAGKDGTGNTEEAQEEHAYKELENIEW